MFENTRVGQDLIDFYAGTNGPQMIDYNPSEDHTVNGSGGTAQFTNAYVQGNVIRRELTTNIIAGDYDQDGYLDLVVIPGGDSNTSNTSLQVFHGLGNTAQVNSCLVVKLDGGNSCVNCTKIPVGAKLIVKAKLDGVVQSTQYREFRIGGANGATTHSLPLEFGLGLHPTTTGSADDVFVKVVWPCGHKEVFYVALTQGTATLTTTTLTHTPPAGGLGTLSGWYVSEVGVSSAMNEMDGMDPIVVNAHLISQGGGLQPLGIAAAELSIRKVGTTAYKPIAMDHVFKPGIDDTGLIVIPVGDYYFDVLPMRLPLDTTTNVDGFEIPGSTDFELRVRSWNRQLGSAEGTTENGAIALMEILPEETPVDIGNWTIENGNVAIISNGLALPAGAGSGGVISRSFLFPADTNFSQFHIVFQIEDTVLNQPYQLSVSCPDLGASAVLKIDFNGTGGPMTVSGLLELEPLASHKNVSLFVSNISPSQLVVPITGFWRAHGPELCPQ
ncbi:MAG: hypothetical protein QM477_03865 [Planctomycetota bacterium]